MEELNCSDILCKFFFVLLQWKKEKNKSIVHYFVLVSITKRTLNNNNNDYKKKENEGKREKIFVLICSVIITNNTTLTTIIFCWMILISFATIGTKNIGSFSKKTTANKRTSATLANEAVIVPMTIFKRYITCTANAYKSKSIFLLSYFV